MIERVHKFNEDFIVRTGADADEVWEGSPVPAQVITHAANDGGDGLMWPDWESYWVERGMTLEDLDARRLCRTLLDFVLGNPQLLRTPPSSV